MSLFTFLFGCRPASNKRARGNGLAVVETPPAGVALHQVRAKSHSDVVRARLAKRDGSVRTAHGPLSYRAREHYVVNAADGSLSVVRRDIFEKTYERRWFGRFAKRPNIVYHYFTLPHVAIVETLEGPQRAEPGDWIMQGVAGELWPVKPEEAQTKYELVQPEQDQPAKDHITPEPAHA